MEPEKYLPFNRTEMIAQCEALAADKADLLRVLGVADRRIAGLEAEYKGFRDSASDTYLRLAKERIALEAAIRGWMHEGRMQTFGDRERMRAEMASCLPVETACEHVWVIGDNGTKFCDECGIDKVAHDTWSRR